LPNTGDFRDRGSKFLSYIFPVSTEEKIKEHLLSLKKAHPKSTHICTAYIRRSKNELLEKGNDDGEPSGSAGLPMLNALKSKDLQDVLAAVVRYYGGTKLGVAGLINAYRSSVFMALDNTNIILKHPMKNYSLTFEYELMGKIMSEIKKAKISLIEKDFGIKPKLSFELKSVGADLKILTLKKKILGLPED